jgi:hypothetical protein
MRKRLGALGALAFSLAGCIYAPARRYPVYGEIPPPRPAAHPVSAEDVTKLVRAGVGEEVILARIRAEGVTSRPSAAQVVSMKTDGVGDRIIDAMISAEPASAREAPPRVIYRYEDAPWWVDPWWTAWPYCSPWHWHFHWRFRL